jgi:protoporphyrinogen oxidase
MERAFGKVFADTFPAAYTRKYWSVEPARMTTDWVGGRVFFLNQENVIEGAQRKLDRQTHYFQKIRYPKKTVHESLARRMREGADIRFGTEVARIDLTEKQLWTTDERRFTWTRLINTLPLPRFVGLCGDLPPESTAPRI